MSQHFKQSSQERNSIVKKDSQLECEAILTSMPNRAGSSQSINVAAEVTTCSALRSNSLGIIFRFSFIEAIAAAREAVSSTGFLGLYSSTSVRNSNPMRCSFPMAPTRLSVSVASMIIRKSKPTPRASALRFRCILARPIAWATWANGAALLSPGN